MAIPFGKLDWITDTVNHAHPKGEWEKMPQKFHTESEEGVNVPQNSKLLLVDAEVTGTTVLHGTAVRVLE
jgi:hypothetical protein